MSTDERVKIELLPPGVVGLDTVLGGGLPALSFNVITGGPGAGKTTLALQIAFANATADRPALCFTGLGEPTVKLMRYQQQFEFFDPRRLGVEVHMLNLSEEILSGHGDMRPALQRIADEVSTLKPGVVVIDSFRSLVSQPAQPPIAGNGPMNLDRFMQILAHHLTTWQVTAFLVGEYDPDDLSNPLFTVADGVLLLMQRQERSSSVRSVQVIKQRGCAIMSGLHTMRISSRGVEIFPRLGARTRPAPREEPRRVSTGIAGLDAMMGGGIPVGDSVVLTGPSGVGKTSFGIEFLAAVERRGESAVVVVFEESAAALLVRARVLGKDLSEMVRAGRLAFVSLGPLDLSVDETLAEIAVAVARTGAQSVVIDSLSGFELALAPSFREDFRESIYRLVRNVTATGVTVLMTVEVVEVGLEVRSSTRQLSFLADDIIQLRYLELQGEMRSVLNVVKMRRSRHSRLLREFEVAAGGVRLGGTLREYDNILARSPARNLGPARRVLPGLTPLEGEVLRRLRRAESMTACELAESFGQPVEVVDSALARILALGLAVREAPPHEHSFRALSRSAGT